MHMLPSQQSLVLDTEQLLRERQPNPNIFLIVDHIENSERDIFPYWLPIANIPPFTGSNW